MEMFVHQKRERKIGVCERERECKTKNERERARKRDEKKKKRIVNRNLLDLLVKACECVVSLPKNDTQLNELTAFALYLVSSKQHLILLNIF